MPRYLIVLSEDDGEDDDSTFVADAFREAVELFPSGVWAVKTDSAAEEIAKTLGIAEGGKRTNWSSIVVPLEGYFAFMDRALLRKLRDLAK